MKILLKLLAFFVLTGTLFVSANAQDNIYNHLPNHSIKINGAVYGAKKEIPISRKSEPTNAEFIKTISEEDGLYAVYLKSGLEGVSKALLLESDIEEFRKQVSKMSYAELREKAAKFKTASYLQ